MKSNYKIKKNLIFFLVKLAVNLLFSVAGFINDVQALNKPNHDSKIQITWASFQKADVNDPALFPEAVEINGKLVVMKCFLKNFI